MSASINFFQSSKCFLTITEDGRFVPGSGLSQDEATQRAAKLIAETYSDLHKQQAATISHLTAELARCQESISDKEIRKRLAAACEALGGQREMAKKIGVADSLISMILNEQKRASARVLAEIGLERVTYVRRKK